MAMKRLNLTSRIVPPVLSSKAVVMAVVTYLAGVELFSVHWCRVLDHHQCVFPKTLTVEVLGVGKTMLLVYSIVHNIVFHDLYATVIQITM